MSYLVETRKSNGYRCSCCQYTYEYSWEVESLEEALKQVPVTLVDGEPHPNNYDYRILEVTVKEISTGDTIAWATASWPLGFRDYGGYDYTYWSGYREDGAFKVLYNSSGDVLDKTWEEVHEDLQKKRQEQERVKAQRDLEDAQKRLKALGASEGL